MIPLRHYYLFPTIIRTYDVKELYADVSNYNNLITANYHVVTTENFDFIIFRDFVFLNINRRF